MDCFQPFKHYHIKAIDWIVGLQDVEFGKLQFLVKFQTIREKTFIKATICNIWKKIGLISFKPEIVFSKIWEYWNIQDIRPTTPPSAPILNIILHRIS